MITNTSPRPTSNEMSREATVQPVFAISSALGRSASLLPITLSACGPNTFQTSRHDTWTSPPMPVFCAMTSAGDVTGPFTAGREGAAHICREAGADVAAVLVPTGVAGDSIQRPRKRSTLSPTERARQGIG